jgi:beta-lactam-binding protein with PASTA domain
VIGLVVSDGTAQTFTSPPNQQVNLVKKEVRLLTVPDATNHTNSDAKQIIIVAGFTIGKVVLENSDTVQQGCVIRQSHPAGLR